jgi:DnaK suppressor protein
MAKKVVKKAAKKVKAKQKPKKISKKTIIKSAKKTVEKLVKKTIKTANKKTVKIKAKKTTKKLTKPITEIRTKKENKSPDKHKIIISEKNENKKNKGIEALLHEERDKVVYELTRLEEISLDKSQREASGDLSGYSIHLADVASDNEEIEKVLKLRSYFEGKIKWIDDALLKVKNGAFGICEECGEFIGVERLRVRPEAKLCIKCKAKMEAVGQY